MMEGGVREFPPGCPCVQGGRCGPLRLDGVSLVVLAMGDEGVGSRELIHFGGLGEVAGDGHLGGVNFASGGVGADVVGRPLVVWGVFCRVQFEWRLERLWRRGFVLGFHVGRYFCLNQVLSAPGFRGPNLGGCSCRGLEEGGGVSGQGGGVGCG